MLVIIAVGALAAVASAVVPHYSNHYRLDLAVLSTGLLPYFVYGVLGWIAPRSTLLHLVAVVNLVAHLWLVASDRFMDFNGYQGGTILYVPVVFAVVLLFLGIMNAHRSGKELAPE